MKFFLYPILAFIIFSALSGFISAQNFQGNKTNGEISGSISGNVIDKISGKPIEFANIIVLKVKDSVMANGGLSNNKGKFLIEKLSPGKYYIKVNFIGYKTTIINDVIIKPPDQLDVKFENIELEITSTNLGEVVITGDKNQVEYNLDKKVVNVDKNILTAGGTALDVMQTIPSIQVDIDGTLSLRGSSNVTIFVDGRPSGLTSLDQMPASMIDKVEIVTNPSARYDPDGMSGVINIVTKQKKAPGYYGMISGNVATDGKYGGSLNLGFNRKAVNVYANLDVRKNRFKTYSLNQRELFNNDTSTYYNQTNNSLRKGFYYNVKLGADFFLNKYNSISVYGVYNQRFGKPGDTTKYETFNYADALTNYYLKSNKGTFGNYGYEINIDYKKTFKANKGQELTASFFYSNSNSESYSDLNTIYILENLLFMDSVYSQTTNYEFFNKAYVGQIDYVHPLNKWGRIETGYKVNYRIGRTNYLLNNKISEELVKDTLSSNDFEYTENIHSAYFIYANNIKKFKFQLGIRAEQVWSEANQITSALQVKNNYFNIFPTVHLKYEFTEMHALQLSYSRRVSRPRSSSLNPFVNYTDPMNITMGNPYLLPEFTNSYELGHLIDFKKTSINTTLFFRETENMITRVFDIDSLGVTKSSYDNLNKGISFGVELIITQGIFKWWKLNGNFSYYGQKYFGNSNVKDFDKINTSWSTKINSSMTFWKNLDVQLSFNYRSVQYIAQSSGDFFQGGPGYGGNYQGRQAANYFFDIGVKKDFLKNKLTLSVRLSDIFNTSRYLMETEGYNYNSNTYRKRQSQVLTFNASYKINGGFKQKKRKSADDNQNDFEE